MGRMLRIGKLWLSAVFLITGASAANAQVSVGVGVNVDIDANAYDTTAPGDPVESVDVFYDQLSPYGMWVDDADMGRVFIPAEDNFVPYTTGHWEYTRLGFVWVSSEPHAWATSHYGRWAYSSPYGRWVWSPDVEWGPAWVEWRQTDADFGWAPLPPPRLVSYTPPVESWHYCGAAHVLDVNITRYYEPRERVVVIHREARPIEHYTTVSNVKVVVGPPPSVLRDHRVEAKPVRVEQKTIGRWTPTEAHAQVQRAQEHRATFEVENQRKVDGNARIHAANVKVIDAHPQLKAQVNVRMEAAKQGKAPPPEHAEPPKPGERPTGFEPKPNPGTPVKPPGNHVEPNRPAPGGAVKPPENHVEPNRPAPGGAVKPPENHVEPNRPAPKPEHAEPTRPTGGAVKPPENHAEPTPAPAGGIHGPIHHGPVESKPAPAPKPEPQRPAEPRPAENHVEAPKQAEPPHQNPAPAPKPAENHPAPKAGGHPPEHKEPEKK
ncbi:MAG: hypothetical protein QM831_33975 [Kofleriaceae bacterium]